MAQGKKGLHIVARSCSWMFMVLLSSVAFLAFNIGGCFNKRLARKSPDVVNRSKKVLSYIVCYDCIDMVNYCKIKYVRTIQSRKFAYNSELFEVGLDYLTGIAQK